MREVTLVQLNDLHGYLVPHPEWLWDSRGFRYENMGGLARIRTVLDEVRAENPYLLFTDNGDTFHGTRGVVESKGTLLLPILKSLGLHAMTGHWDFAYGPKHLIELTESLPYPFLAANVYDKEDGRLIFPPVRRVDLGPTRVGIIGLACNIVDKTMPPSFSEGIRFTNGDEELPMYIQQLRERERCDVIVLLSHLGLPQDLDLVRRVPGIDVCLSAHTHNRLESPIVVNSTIVIQSGCHGSFLGVLHIGIDEGGVHLLQHKLISITEDIQEHAETRHLVEEATGVSNADEVVGATSIGLHRATMLDSPADSLLLEAMQAATSTEIGFINGWRYGAPIPPGPITAEALFNFAPMNPEITTLEISGDEIWQMLEENLERTFSREPFKQMGGFVKRCGGMKVFFKLENPAGSRLQEIFIGADKLEHSRIYHACYVTMQAVPEKYGRSRKQSGKRLIETVIEYLANREFRMNNENSFIEV